MSVCTSCVCAQNDMIISKTCQPVHCVIECACLSVNSVHRKALYICLYLLNVSLCDYLGANDLPIICDIFCIVYTLVHTWSI